jgi:peptide/nickel transport system permease protein
MSTNSTLNKRATFLYRAWRRFHRNSLVIFGISVVSILLFLTIFAPIVSPYDPREIHYDRIYEPPNSKNLLGSDELGRDVLSRIIWGARSSLTVGIIAVSISTILGVIVGLISGYYGGRIDNLIMRITDMIMTIPSLFFAIVLVSVFKVRGLWVIIAVIGLLGWPSLARVVRSSVLSVKERAFIEASRSIGERDFNIIFKEILPNIITPITIIASMRMGQAILIESSLSFLGLSDPSTITWGRMLVSGQQVLNVAWWIATYPGLAIFITVLGFNLLGDGLRDALDVRVS